MEFIHHYAQPSPAYLELAAQPYLSSKTVATTYPVSSNTNAYSLRPSYPTFNLTGPSHTSDPLENFFLGQKIALARTVEDIVGSIEERVTLKYANLRKIDYESCQTQTKIFDLERWHLGANPNIDKQRTTFERELLGLEREKRMEEVACWRDIARLKSELREASQELDREKRRSDLLK